MAHIEDDFAAYTTIGDRVAPVSTSSPTKAASSASQGPKFGVPSKLEPFTLLAKSARGAGAANLITQAISAPGVYVFSELLQLPSIRDLATNEQHAGQYRLLELFAYGTWNDYNSARDQYPALTTEQETKLKQLTILSLASETRILPYTTLLSSLDVPSIPLLEDLLIESIYSNIFVARLDQKSSQLEILSSQGRDVKPSSSSSSSESMELDSTNVTTSETRVGGVGGGGNNAPSISTLLTSLQAWQNKIDQLLSSLDQHLATLNANSINQTKKQLQHEEKVREMVFEVAMSKAGGGGGKGKSKDTNVVHGTTAPAGWGGTSSGDKGGSAGAGAGGAAGDMEVDLPGAGSAAGVTRGAMSPGGGPGQRTRKRGRM